MKYLTLYFDSPVINGYQGTNKFGEFGEKGK